MRRCLPFVALLAALLFPLPAAAQPSNTGVRFALHAIARPIAKPPPDPCPGTVYSADPVTQGVSCSSYTTARPANSENWVYVVAGQGNAGIDGVSFGVAYNGLYEPAYLFSSSWNLCSDGMDFPSQDPPWPASGSGIQLTWDTCQETVVVPDGVHAVVAKFYMYAYAGAHFKVTPNFTTVDAPELNVNTCGEGTTKLLELYDEIVWSDLLGRVDFGGGSGKRPCILFATEPSTWGRLKTRFTGPGDR